MHAPAAAQSLRASILSHATTAYQAHPEHIINGDMEAFIYALAGDRPPWLGLHKAAHSQSGTKVAIIIF